jgi:hypothetical protein
MCGGIVLVYLCRAPWSAAGWRFAVSRALDGERAVWRFLALNLSLGSRLAQRYLFAGWFGRKVHGTWN